MATTFKGRPEETADAQLYYNESEAKKYAMNSRMVNIQHKMAERCYELLKLPPGRKLLLDLGAGSGLSGSVLSEHGHIWIGCDISRDMLDAATARESEGDLFHSDLGQGLYFREGMFDGAISVSTIQWLCSCAKKSHNPYRRLNRFFESLQRCLKRPARAVFQLYPKNSEQLQMIADAAKRTGFNAGLVIDNPESTKNKKFYLICDTGNIVTNPDTPDSQAGTSREISFTKASRVGKKRRQKKPAKGSKEWIAKKKSTRMKKGLKMTESKYTGRKRRHKF